MNITVKTGGLLGKYLPAGSPTNLAELDMPDGATVTDVMAHGATVRKAARDTHKLSAGDTLAIVPPLKGG
jgi:molybdopterin converting factor small subunit